MLYLLILPAATAEVGNGEQEKDTPVYMLGSPAEGNVGVEVAGDVQDVEDVEDEGGDFHEEGSTGVAGAGNGAEKNVAGDREEEGTEHDEEGGDGGMDEGEVVGIDAEDSGRQDGG